METVHEVYASRASGLEGDRYGQGRGSWSTTGRTHRQVSLIAEEAIGAANRELDRPFEASETRRNILTRGIDLNVLAGRTFRIGGARLRGTKLCAPCQRPAKLAGEEALGVAFAEAFEDRGGLCAEVIEDGLIRTGDEIVPEE
ncbi:MAG: MOSC domain-containing protein [Candidatus Sungbacteria bacterium]|nr:MOSC domain-containing protein [Candidatus Sungbacteria bacterium]